MADPENAVNLLAISWREMLGSVGEGGLAGHDVLQEDIQFDIVAVLEEIVSIFGKKEAE